MSASNSIDQRKLQFEQQQKLAHAAEEVKLKSSPPLVGQRARFAVKPNGSLPTGFEFPKAMMKKKLTQQLSLNQSTVNPSPPPTIKPSVPLLPKAGSPGVKQKERAWQGDRDSQEASDQDKAKARNVLAGFLTSGAQRSPVKKPLPPLKPTSPGRHSSVKDDRMRSMDISKARIDPDRSHMDAPTINDECQERAKNTKLLLLDNSNSEDTCVQKSDLRVSDVYMLPKEGQLKDNRTKNGNGISWRQECLNNKSLRQDVVSLTGTPSREVSKKPLPPPKKPAHLMSPERNSAKARSTSDLTGSGKDEPAVPPRKLPRTPQPGRAGETKLPGGGVRLSGNVARFNADGAKPLVGGAKPSLGGGVKPILPVSKPKPATPIGTKSKPATEAEIKPKPATPAGSKPKPAIPTGTKPKPAMPAGKKPVIGSKPAAAKFERHLPTPPPKTTNKSLESPKRKPFPPSKPSTSKPGTVSGLRDSHFGRPVSEDSLLLPPSQEEGVSGSISDDLRSSSEADISRMELDETLTFPLSGEGQRAGDEGQRVELEDTVVLAEEEKGDWVVLTSHSGDQPSEEVTLPRKPLPAAPKSVNKQPPVVGEIASSPPVANKPLPSTPSQRVKGVPKALQTLGTGSESEGESSTGKISSLVSVFSPSPSSAAVSRYPPPVNVEAEPPRSPGVPGEGGTKPAGITPAGSPLIRISPSSFSKTITSGANEQGQETTEGGGRDTSSRGNVDSGFLSEVPDELSLLRGASVESLSSSTSEERGGVASPPPFTPEEVERAEPEVWDEARVEKARKKRLNIASELLSTEKTYSTRIKVIAVDFYDVVQRYNVKSKHAIPDSAVQQIFLNLKQIHQLSENILQELQERMDMWSSNEALGDVICRLAPFLKLYAHYTSGFEDAVKMLTECTKRDRKFDAVVREFERTSVSTGLGLASFMLEPVSRIPRYRLLLLDYLKYLHADSPDRPNTESALRIISEAADHSNDRIKELENSNIILSIQRSLVDYDGTLLAPYRAFIMKGTLLKSSRKTLSPRFFFLFSDILLHTYSPEKEVYRFRNEMPIFGMKVEDPKVSLVPFSFNIYSTTRSLILVASCEEEKGMWISALQSAILDDMKKRSSLRRDAHLQITKAGSLFGTKPPIMVPDKSATMCQGCSSEFTRIFRRHHCRACGKVVCSNCSQQKAYLPYLRKVERVCVPCYAESKNPDRMSGDESLDGSPASSPVGTRKRDSANITSSVLNLKAYEEDAVFAGYVFCLEGKKTWNKMWYQVKKDCVLYKFKAHEDIKAVNSMPLPGYAVGSDSAQHTITLTHHSGMKNLCDSFKVDDAATFDSWLDAIRKVIRMEFDAPPSSHTLVTSPLTQSFSASCEHTPSSRPLSENSFSSRPNSFSTVSSSDSRPSSMREVSPSLDQGTHL